MDPRTEDRFARALALTVMVGAPLAFGLLSLALGQDANWDLRNYHWYNAYAFLEGRIGFDLLPAQTPSFYNPTLDIPFYLLASAASARTAGFLVGAVQGLNMALLFLLARSVLRIDRPLHKASAAAAIALVGMIGGGGLAQIGTTFHDNVVSLGVVGGLAVIARHHGRIFIRPDGTAAALVLVAGVLVGSAAGLKQPSVVFCVGLCAAFLLAPVRPAWRLAFGFVFGIGVLAGIAAFSGHWMWSLWQDYANPLFPYFNDIFQSPMATVKSYRDTNFLDGKSLAERFLLPLVFATDPFTVGEIYWRDLRIPILFVLLPIAIGLGMLGRGDRDRIADPASARFILAAFCLSYAVWAVLFGIYRYIIPLEMLAPLALVLCIDLLPARRRARAVLAGGVLLAVLATVAPGNWGRTSWGERFVEVSVPPIADPDRTMILMAGYQPTSYVVPAFPPQIPFVRIQSNFMDPRHGDTGFNRLLRARVAAHDGPFLVLNTPGDAASAAEALDAYGLVLVAGTCQMVHTNLGEPLSLCTAERTGAR